MIDWKYEKFWKYIKKDFTFSKNRNNIFDFSLGKLFTGSLRFLIQKINFDQMTLEIFFNGFRLNIFQMSQMMDWLQRL